MILNTEGTDIESITYGPYGNLVQTGNGTIPPLGYDAQYTTNPNTTDELIYLRARTYDPNTAQFLTNDPALEETGEPYAYTTDNQLNLADPTGLCRNAPAGPCTPLELIAVAGKQAALAVYIASLQTAERLVDVYLSEVQEKIDFFQALTMRNDLTKEARKLANARFNGEIRIKKWLNKRLNSIEATRKKAEQQLANIGC
jgi:RHS repeat-associated protein